MIQSSVLKPFLVSFQCNPAICDHMIEIYNEAKTDGFTREGTQGSGDHNFVDKTVKDSEDLGISWLDVNYTNEPRMMMYMDHLGECLRSYFHLYPYHENSGMWDMIEGFNIQKYPKGGGFKQYHSEWGAPEPNCWRNLVFMTYLTDCDPKQGGGTNFLHHGVTHPSIKGTTLIWPAGLEWMHVGIPTEEKEKMIVTGWWHCTTPGIHKRFTEHHYSEQLQQMQEQKKQWTVSQADIKTDPKIKSYKPGEGVILKKSHNN